VERNYTSLLVESRGSFY